MNYFKRGMCIVKPSGIPSCWTVLIIYLIIGDTLSQKIEEEGGGEKGKIISMITDFSDIMETRRKWTFFLIEERIYLGTWLQRVRAHDGGTKSWHPSQEAKHSHPELQARLRDWAPGMKHDFKTSKLTPERYFLKWHHTSQSYPNSATNWVASIRISKPMGGILIQTTMLWKDNFV